MLEVELAKLRALLEAVHHGDLIVMQIYLDEISQATECTSHFSKEVVLEVDVHQVGALTGKNVLVWLVRVGHTNG